MILCSGCFDGVHWGHIRYLTEAAKLTRLDEELVIAVADDAYIRFVKNRNPRWTSAERKGVLGVMSFGAHDEKVIDHGPFGAADVIRSLRPRLFVKGNDWRDAGLPDDIVAACKSVGCQIVFVDSVVKKHSADALSAHQ